MSLKLSENDSMNMKIKFLIYSMFQCGFSTVKTIELIYFVLLLQIYSINSAHLILYSVLNSSNSEGMN